MNHLNTEQAMRDPWADMNLLDPGMFVRFWQTSSSLTEVSVRLTRAGHPDITPNLAFIFGWVLRRSGVNLKEMQRSDLPNFTEDATTLKKAE